jgi:hypothetical protein
MQFTVNASANNQAIVFTPQLGQGKLLLENVSATVACYFHQGHSLNSALVASGAEPGTVTVNTESAAHTANSSRLAAGESIVLDFTNAVRVHSGAANVAITFNATPLT